MTDRVEGAVRLQLGAPAHGGHVVARHEGRVVFVRHGLPGEVVRARFSDSGEESRFWRADVVEVIEASPDRVPSRWPEAGPGGVGGGELAHVALGAQRAWKEAVITDTLRRIGHIDADVDVLAAPGDDDRDGLATRTRVELTVTDDGIAGMHAHRSHRVRPLTQMPLAVPELAELGVFERRWRGGSRLDLIAPSDGLPLILLDGEPVRGGRKLVREIVRSGGQEYRYRVSASGFWQVHREAPAILIETVLRASGLQDGQRVWDLYSGAGLLTSPLARAVGESGSVLAVEQDATAVRDARRNAHDLPQVGLHQGKVDAALTELAAGPRPDVVVLDPPRAGAGKAVMGPLLAAGPGRVVYVACDPASLARDLRLAVDSGYRLVSLTGRDLFPHTHHVECVAVLEPGIG